MGQGHHVRTPGLLWGPLLCSSCVDTGLRALECGPRGGSAGHHPKQLCHLPLHQQLMRVVSVPGCEAVTLWFSGAWAFLGLLPEVGSLPIFSLGYSGVTMESQELCLLHPCTAFHPREIAKDSLLEMGRCPSVTPMHPQQGTASAPWNGRAEQCRNGGHSEEVSRCPLMSLPRASPKSTAPSPHPSTPAARGLHRWPTQRGAPLSQLETQSQGNLLL